MNKRLNILAVHQGGELYGSDRSFLQVLRILQASGNIENISVLLGGSGPLEAEIRKLGLEAQVESLWIAHRPTKITSFLRKILALPMSIYKASRRGSQYDLVYINTIVVADFLISRLLSRNTIVHVREIPPRGILGRTLRQLVRISRAEKIYNSRATLYSFCPSPKESDHIIYNSVSTPKVTDEPKIKGSHIHFLVVGRISDWKGQDLAVQASAKLRERGVHNFRLSIVGDVYGEFGHFRTHLEDLIRENDLQEHIILEGFKPDTSNSYQASDVVIVPSRRPEPFGRVAIEAFSHSIPVIAAKHGGLMEIVEHQRSGLLFEPNSIEDLAQKMQFFINNPRAVEVLGRAAEREYQARFTEEVMAQKINDVIRKKTK